jgi:hypothetical protein
VKKILVVAGTLVVLAGIAAAVYAAYPITGSGGGGFTAGTAADLGVSPESGDLDGILPNGTKVMDVLITNNDTVGVTVTGLSLAFNDLGNCNLSYVNPGWYPFGLGGGLGKWVTVNVSMADADPSCEGNAGLTVTATAYGTMP